MNRYVVRKYSGGELKVVVCCLVTVYHREQYKHPPPRPTPPCDPRARAPDLVKVVEGGAVLIELLLADALSVTRQDLVLNLVDGSGDGGQQLLPAHAEVLRGGGRGAIRESCNAMSSGEVWQIGPKLKHVG